MLKLLTSFLSIFLMASLSYSQSATVQVTEPKVKTELIVGAQYEIVKYAIKALSRPLDKALLHNVPSSFTNPLEMLNRLLLYGPAGNGKSTLAKEIADAANCEFVNINAPGLVTKYQGSGVENIKKELKKAFDKVVESGRPVVILIDEIDALAITGKGDSRVDDNKAMQELWLQLDLLKNDPRVFIICATNKFKELNETFMSRFPEEHRLSIGLPHYDVRVKMLRKFAQIHNLNIEDGCLSCLAYYSDGLSIRQLEYFIIHAKTIQSFDKPLTGKQIVEKMCKKNPPMSLTTKLTLSAAVVGTGALLGNLPGAGIGMACAAEVFAFNYYDWAKHCWNCK